MKNYNMQLGLEILLGAVALGLAAESLLVEAGWGLGASLWVVALGALGIALLEKWHKRTVRFTRFLFIPMLILALCYGWRDAVFLKIATTVGLTVVLGLVMQSSQNAFSSAARERVPGVLGTGLQSLFGLPSYLKRSVDWSRLGTGIDRATTKSALRGVFIAAPCLLVFGFLLSSADKRFDRFLDNMIDIDVLQLPGRVLLATCYALFAGAFLYGSLTLIEKKARASDKKRFELSMLEAGIVLGLINLMFGAFVLIQMDSMFTGMASVDAVSGVSLKYYTRKGFFELVIVASLALPLLMWLKRYFKPSKQGHQLQFSILAGAQIGLLLVMLVSAAQRMWLYTDAYGITELRLYASVFMVWLAFVLGWFAWTALWGFALKFVRGSVLVGAVMVIGLNVLNPDAFIVSSNIERALAGKAYDSDSLKKLSADAIPVVIEALPRLKQRERAMLVESLQSYWQERSAKDWRDWNLSKQRAAVQVQTALASLQHTPTPAPERP